MSNVKIRPLPFLFLSALLSTLKVFGYFVSKFTPIRSIPLRTRRWAVSKRGDAPNKLATATVSIVLFMIFL